MSTRVTRPGCVTAREHPRRVWQTAALMSTQALRAWETAPASMRARAYFDYRVALEREELAAEALETGCAL